VKKLLTIAALTATTFTAQAEVRINGFANLIGGITSSDETLFGYEDNISFSEESLFAIQVSGDINDKMTATGQIVARADNDYKAEFEWAYFSYQATDNWSVSAGRLRLPLFSYSASLDVGYSYHWVTAPETVYDVPFNNLDGIRVDYTNYSDDWEYNLSLSTGTFDGPAFGTSISGDNVFFLSAEATYDWFKIRAVGGTGNSNLDLNASGRADLQQASAGLAFMSSIGFNELEDSLQIRDDTGNFLGLSVQIDKFDWFVNAEVTSIDIEDSFLTEQVAYYATAGIRSGKWTPSITYAKFKADAEVKFQSQLDQVTVAPLPDEAKAVVTGTALGLLFSDNSENNTLSATIRYDYDTNVALKVDLSKFSNDLNEAEDVTLLRFAVNYIF
jgi:hypothetical protein